MPSGSQYLGRIKPCVICGSPLPEGARIDRRYCRESCRVQAYRQRHQDQRAPARPRPVQAAPNDAGKPQTESPLLAEQIATAVARIENLEGQCRALRQRAAAAELQLETTQRRMTVLEAALQTLRAAGRNGKTWERPSPRPCWR